MGLTLLAISNIIIKPLPKKHRAEIVTDKTTDYSYLVKGQDNKNPAGVLSFTFSNSYHSSQNNTKIIIKEPTEIWLDKQKEKDSFIYVDWYTNRIFHMSEDSDVIKTGGELFDSLLKTLMTELDLNKKYYESNEALVVYKKLKLDWERWKKTYESIYDMPEDVEELKLYHDFDDIKKENFTYPKNELIYIYRKLVGIFWYGANAGIVIII